MVQTMGTAMVLAAGVGIGIVRARELYARPRHIRALIQALSALEAQIVYAQIPLADGLRQCTAGCGEEEIGRLFRLIADRLSLDKRCCPADVIGEVQVELRKETSLGQAEWSVLTFLCDNLGRTDCRETEKQLRLAIEQLKTIGQGADKDAQQKGRAAVYLGICGALMAVVVCI